MKEDIGEGLEGHSHCLNAILYYYLPGGIGGKA
jgi:hypothetical protein